MITAVPPARRIGRILKGLAAVGLLGTLAATLHGCGGGDRVDPFRPTRMVIFGDENSFMQSSDSTAGTALAVNQPDGSAPTQPAGTRYTVNVAYDSAPAPFRNNACNLPDTLAWFQTVAGRYGLVLEGCNYDNLPTQASTWATEGATAADIINSINAYQSTPGRGPLGDGDLVTVLGGTNDILQAYTDYKNGTPLSTLRDRVKNAGLALSNKVADIQEAGAHVMLITTPDLGLSPYASAELGGPLTLDLATTNRTDCERSTPANAQQVLSVLTDCFNLGLRSSTRLQGTGRRVALVRVDQDIRAVAASPASYLLTNVTEKACKPANPVPACHYELASNGSSAGQNELQNDTAHADYLWAGDYWLTPAGHTRIAALAVAQARTNWE